MIQRKKRRSEQECLSIIQECQASDLSIQSWCKQHGISTSTLYSKISKLKKVACDIQKVDHYQTQEVVPLEIIDDVEVSSNKPAIVLNIQAYRIEISNHAAKETISNTLSVLQQLC